MSNNNKKQESTSKLLWLGVFFVFLAAFSFIYSLYSKVTASNKPRKTVSFYDQFTYGSGEDNGETGKRDLLEELNFQAVHGRYQTAYIDLVDRINSMDMSKLNIKEAEYYFNDYKAVQYEYTKTLKKIDDYEKKFKLQCFGRMRSLIMAVLYADKHLKKRVTKFDPEKLIEIGALREVPVCPRGGTYSIIYKDGRRLFNCSMHGILRNKR